MIEDIKRRDFATSAPLDDREVVGTDFIGTLLNRLRTTAPFLRFVTEALGLRALTLESRLHRPATLGSAV